jgi:hypothetical protein
MARSASVMRQRNSGTPCLTRQGTFQPLEPSTISYQPGVFLKIVFAALPKIVRVVFNFYNIMYKNKTGFVYNSVGFHCHGPQPSDLQRW